MGKATIVIHATDEDLQSPTLGGKEEGGKESHYNVMDLKIPWEFHIQGPNISVRDSKVD